MNQELLIGMSPEIPLGGFVVVRVKSDKKSLMPCDIDELFTGDGSQASLLLGLGIANNSAETDKTMMVFNPDEIVIFPNIDEGE